MVLRRYTVRGVSIALWEQNDPVPVAQPLVFIHGSGCDHTMWEYQYPVFADDHRVIGLNLPGHGESGGAGEKTVDNYVAWVKEILDACGCPRPVLIGHSLGAAITLRYALRFPQDISGIVPVGGGARMPVNPMIFRLLRDDPATAFQLIAKFSLAKPNREMHMSDLMEGMMASGIPLMEGDLTACDIFDVTDQLPTVSVPALLVCGDDDKMTPPSLSRDLASLIPGASLSLIAGAGHFVMLERPEAFNRAVKSFVDSLAGGDSQV